VTGLTCAPVDVLVPTRSRPGALAVTLAGLAAQDHRELRVVVSDQSDDEDRSIEAPEVAAMARVLRATGRAVELHRHLPRRGLAEQRHFLLDRATAPYALFVDDDVFLEPDLVSRLVRAIRLSGAGFIGSAVVGLSFEGDRRPEEEAIEFWDGPVLPEVVAPGSPAWQRYRLHNAANLEHVRATRPGDHDRLYKVAWVGGCVLYDTARLRAAGGFDFWQRLPHDHAGEDVLAQQRVMARFGGAGLFPSGAYHLELPTTVTERSIDAPIVLAELVSSR